MKNIGIIGAGWLGKDLAIKLAEHQTVRITNRSNKLIEGCEIFHFEIGEELNFNFLKDLDFLFITSTLPKDNKLILHFCEELKKINQKCLFIFTSTTSVYSSEIDLVDENSIELNQESIYFQMEQLLLSHFAKRIIILRLGGLIGEDRHPIYHLAGRTNVLDGQKHVNLVHKTDVLSFLNLITEQTIPVGIYNLVYPLHPSREIYYHQKAIEFQLEKPIFLSGEMKGKIVNSTKSEQIKSFYYTTKI